MEIDLLIAALLGFIVGSFATVIILALCAAGKGEEDGKET